ncbi:MAG: hypothetical protein RB292_01040 [Patescibacteria group bacterium]|jgi:hypothetical protein|nr:hypothetical protein [Patescibacteria group bacterium]
MTIEHWEIGPTAEEAWQRALSNGKDCTFVGWTAFVAIIKWSQEGHGEVVMVENDRPVEGMTASQVIEWCRDGQVLRFRTITKMDKPFDHPLCQLLKVGKPAFKGVALSD